MPPTNPTSFDTLEIERDGPILRVWLSRPERLNAISPVMLRELGDLFGGLETDWETRVVVLGGRGRSFCAGADRKGSEPSESGPRSDREARWNAQLGRRACRAIEDCEVPVVARVHGHAIGGGACFALSCDFRVVTNDALFQVPELDLGIPLTWGATPRLIHELGASRAREVLMLGDRIDAATAAAWGIAHRVVAPEALDDTVDDLAGRLAGKPEMAVYMTRTQLRSYAKTASLGDVTESDGDLLTGALRSASAQGRFALKRED